MLPRTALVVDPRFSGGTSTAVAQEIYTLAPICDLTVVCLKTAMFKGEEIHPRIVRACLETWTRLAWAGETIQAEVVALHNPSSLKFDREMPVRIVCDKFYVVCHENFLRPAQQQGQEREGFDVAHCLRLIENGVLARIRLLAPISANNRKTIVDWLSRHSNTVTWQVDPLDWTNICEFNCVAPVSQPRDRRGRHSRPGFEKFPGLDVMKVLFPHSAEAVRLLGANDLMLENSRPSHWQCLPFGAEPVDQFLSTIDFFVYFTNPGWRESFGRVLAEAMAAGKVVITDPETASTFGAGAICAKPEDVNSVISDLISDPAAYREQVLRGQTILGEFSAEAFRRRHRFRIDRDTSARTSALEFAHAVF